MCESLIVVLTSKRNARDWEHNRNGEGEASKSVTGLRFEYAAFFALDGSMGNLLILVVWFAEIVH